MNIQNIVSLTGRLKQIGFHESVGKRLLQHACFRPSDFSLLERINKDQNLLICSLNFERKGEEYDCNYYDVSLLVKLEFPDRLMHSVNVKDLDFRMSQISWEANDHSNKELSLEDQSTWQREKDIETIVLELSQLASSDEGKYFTEYLKLKHWSRGVPSSLMGNLNVLRSKFEISQRFYFIGGQEISVEEAYRFLLNRWMEKQQNLKRKTNGSINQEEAFTDSSSSGGKGLLTKKRKLKTMKVRQ
jgi:hypothetical protein